MSIPKKSKSYYAIVKASKDLFWKFGVKKVTVEEIVKEAGVSKMTFYRLFENKIVVAKVMLIDMMEVNLQNYYSIMEKDIPYTEKVKEMLLLKQSAANDISKEFVNEVYLNQELGLIAVFDDYRNKMMKAFLDDMKQAQVDGYIRKDLNIEFVLYMLNVMASESIVNDHLLSMYDNSQDAIMEVTNFFFYGIMEPNTDKK